MTMRITALDHFVLRVAKLERAIAFYRDVLGLEILFLEEFERGERPFVSARIGEQLLDLIPDPNYDPQEGAAKGGFLHFCARFDGPDFAAVIGELERRGVEILTRDPEPRMGAVGISRSIYVRDPDGYILELKEN
jgi:catechol 2,3-dioxygenase-like lactoylglutathione lyase family enzyme